MELEEWLEARGQPLGGFALLVCADRELAQEVVQDVLCHAVTRWQHIKHADDIDAYMRRSVINRRNSIMRRIKLRRETSPGFTLRPAPDPAEVHELWDACARLRPKYRDALVLRFYVDLPYAQIATVMSIREATARGYVMRAIAELREQLSDASMEVETRD